MSGVNIKINIDTNAIADRLMLPLTDTMYDVCNAFVDIVDPYVPYDTGKLSGEVDFAKITNGALVTYTAPYARKQYYGEEFHHNTEYHPLATAYWDKVAMQTKRDEFNKEVERIVKEHYRNG